MTMPRNLKECTDQCMRIKIRHNMSRRWLDDCMTTCAEQFPFIWTRFLAWLRSFKREQR